MENTHKFSISVIVPVHHQVRLIEPSVGKITSFLKDHGFDYEIILIDSGGNDGSSEKCDSLAANNPRIKVFHDPVNTKFGAKMRIGYRKAQKDLIWPIGLDLPFPLEKILEAEPLFEKYDAVFSYRSSDPRPVSRRFQSFIYNTTLRLFLGIKVRHINSAFRVFKRRIVSDLPLISNGWFIDAEVLYYIINKKIPYTEIPVPIVIHPDQYKSFVTSSAFMEVLKEMFRFLKQKRI